MPAASGAGQHPHVELGEVPIVDARPAVAAVADHPHQPVQRVAQHVRDDAAAAAVDDARPDHHGGQRSAGHGQYLGFVGGAPGDVRDRIGRDVFGRRHRPRPEHPDPGGVDEPPRHRAAGQRRQRRVEKRALHRRAARLIGHRGMDHDVQFEQCRQKARRLAEVADDRGGTPRLQPPGLFRVAGQRGHAVAGPDQGVDHGRADVASTAGEEHAHGIRPPRGVRILLGRATPAPLRRERRRGHRSQTRPPS